MATSTGATVPARPANDRPAWPLADGGRGIPDHTRLIDDVIRHRGVELRCASDVELAAREWMLVDTRRCDPGEYLIRAWIGARGVPRPVECPPSHRRGGAIGLFTIHDGCIASGPCPPGVDEGAGLLLVGFAGMLAVPLPRSSHLDLGANWLVVLSAGSGALPDPEIDRLFSRAWTLFNAHSGCEGAPRSELSRGHSLS